MATLNIADLARLRQETDFNINPCTVLMWIKPTNSPVNYDRIAFLNNVFIIDAGTNGQIRFRDNGATVFPTVTTANNVVVAGVELFIACRLTGSTATFFVNGIPIGSSAITSAGTDTGFHIAEQSASIYGEYGCVRVFNQAIGDFLIRNIYHSRGRDGIITGQVSRWDFTEILEGGPVVSNTIKNKMGFTGDIDPQGSGSITGGPGTMYLGNRRRIA